MALSKAESFQIVALKSDLGTIPRTCALNQNTVCYLLKLHVIEISTGHFFENLVFLAMISVGFCLKLEDNKFPVPLAASVYLYRFKAVLQILQKRKRPVLLFLVCLFSLFPFG